jgi:hypothetical protein
MKGKTKKIVLALVVIGVVAAGGAAFTAANTVDPSVAGYGTAIVTGATATSVKHTLSPDGTHIVSTHIVFSADQTGNDVVAGFGTTAVPEATLVPCVVTTTDAECTYATPWDTATATHFNVAVTDTP